MNETGVSEPAGWPYPWSIEGHMLFSLKITIYIIYTPNLGLRIAIPGREREQGRFRGSTGQARRRSRGARESGEGASESIMGSTGAQQGGI